MPKKVFCAWMIALACRVMLLACFLFNGAAGVTYPGLTEAQIRHDGHNCMLLDIEVMVRVQNKLPVKDCESLDGKDPGDQASNRIAHQLGRERSDGHAWVPHGEKLIDARSNL